MSTNINESEIHLVRTNNGEYISDEYCVFASPIQAKLRLAEAQKYGFPLEKHILPDGSIWFYKHELKKLAKFSNRITFEDLSIINHD